jgi:hypothetical protein
MLRHPSHKRRVLRTQPPPSLGCLVQVEGYLGAKQAEFAAKLQELVGDTRARIAALWDEMRAGPGQRSDMFPPFFQQGE